MHISICVVLGGQQWGKGGGKDKGKKGWRKMSLRNASWTIKSITQNIKFALINNYYLFKFLLNTHFYFALGGGAMINTGDWGGE